MRKNICIVGHWASCNFGDRYQPFALLNHLVQFEPVCVNLFEYDVPFVIDNYVKILSPSQVKDVLFDVVVFTTGSIYDESTYLPLIAGGIKSRKTIVWGGFARGTHDFATFSRNLACLKNVLFLARSEADLELYCSVVGDASKGQLGGDPMVLLSEFSEEKGKGIAIITSCYAEKRNLEYWKQIYLLGDVFLLDAYGDKGIDGRVLSTPAEFNAVIKQYAYVISSRLHGGVMGALSGRPTLMVNVNSFNPFKFEAVSLTASGVPLCNFANPEFPLVLSFDKYDIDKYRELSFDSIKCIINEST